MSNFIQVVKIEQIKINNKKHILTKNVQEVLTISIKHVLVWKWTGQLGHALDQRIFYSNRTNSRVPSSGQIMTYLIYQMSYDYGPNLYTILGGSSLCLPFPRDNLADFDSRDDLQRKKHLLKNIFLFVNFLYNTMAHFKKLLQFLSYKYTF